MIEFIDASASEETVAGERRPPDKSVASLPSVVNELVSGNRTLSQQQQQQQQHQQKQQKKKQQQQQEKLRLWNRQEEKLSERMGEKEGEFAQDAQHANDLATSAGPIELSSKANYIDRSDIKPTRKRYLILLLFCLHSAINAMQWIYLSSITNIVSQFYRVDNMAINWTSMVYMLVYIPLVVPSTWLFERMGMRNSILLGSLGTTLGSLIKCFCCQPNRFTLLMFGQTLVAASQLFVLSVPPRLAAVWFPDHQVSLANACGVFGNQLGIAMGFVLPPLVLGEESVTSLTHTQSGLLVLFVAIALCSALTTLLIALLFDQSPSKAPGLARLQQIKRENARAEAGVLPLVLDSSASSHNCPTTLDKSSQHLPNNLNSNTFGALLYDLLTDLNFVLLMTSYGLNVGVFYAISTVLNQMISPGWPANANTLVGRLGLLMIIAGMFGSVISGFILDKTRRYRLVNTSLYALSLVSLLVFALTIEQRHSATLHLSAILLGYFMTGYLFIGYEMSNEITWPRPESVTAGLLNLSAQVSYAAQFICTGFVASDAT